MLVWVLCGKHSHGGIQQMTKKLLGLAVLAFLCVGMASASMVSELCPTTGGTVTNTGVNGATPSLSATEVCPALTGFAYTITEIDLIEGGDFQLAMPGTDTMLYSMTFTGAVTGTASETVTGTGGSGSYSFTSPCTQIGITDQATCAFAGNGTGTVGSITTTWSGIWTAGGLLTDGSEGVASYVNFQYSTGVPEPASLLMIGGGLMGLAILTRRKRRA
jgi:hypothetical protein